MAIKKLDDGRWFVDIEPVKGKRFRKTVKTKAEALRFEAHYRSQVTSASWQPEAKDNRKLLELVTLWHELHGHSLRDANRRLSKLKLMCKWLKNPIARQIQADQFAAYRRERLEAGITPKTLNNELGYLRSVFNELIALNQINYENPLKLLRPLVIQERELSWLTKRQIHELLVAIDDCDNPHVKPITLLCLSTGARWSEAESLKARSLRGNVVTFSGTKSGRVRSVPIAQDLVSLVQAHWKQYGYFTSSLSAFRRALGRTTIELPRGQASHALRHTFASHFMQNGGNILTLQKILGHSSLAMTMRYAHLAPEHLQDAISFNPLNDFDTLSTVGQPKKQNP